jgi:DNA-binding NarL/FixJ family response regulator
LAEFARLANRPDSALDAEVGDDLTFREREVLRLIAAGATDKEIAKTLSLSLHTVKSHVRNILSKLHAANRQQAARLATRHGIVQTKPEG